MQQGGPESFFVPFSEPSIRTTPNLAGELSPHAQQRVSEPSLVALHDIWLGQATLSSTGPSIVGGMLSGRIPLFWVKFV